MILYRPCPSVTAVRTFSIKAGLATSTVTPGTTAPDVSRTTPAIAPVWAKDIDVRHPTNPSETIPVRTALTAVMATLHGVKQVTWQDAHQPRILGAIGGAPI